MPAQPKRKPKRRPSYRQRDVVTLKLTAEQCGALTVWANRAGVSRSALGRWIVGEMLPRITRMGRHQLRARLQAATSVESLEREEVRIE